MSRKRTTDVNWLSNESVRSNDELQDTLTFSSNSHGQNHKKKRPKRVSINPRTSYIDPYEPPVKKEARSNSAYYLDSQSWTSSAVHYLDSHREDQPSHSTLPNGASISHHDETTPLLAATSHEEHITNMEDGYNQNGREDDLDKLLFSYTPVPNSFNIMPEVRPRRAHELSHQEFDSLDYDVGYNIPYKNQLRSYKSEMYTHMEVMRWVLVCIIGVLTGLVAFGINMIVKLLFRLKYGQFERVLEMTMYDGRMAIGFLVLLGFNVVFVIVAALLVALEPVAAGSGIPEIKCYLNGVKVPHVTRIGTLVAKAVGVLFSVAGGFLVGKEGPMIHSGAILGAGLPQFRSFFLKKLKLPYHYFRSDRDKRDFVSCGAAAGVAAAFGAPIGGVLFSLEEGSSFWNQSLTWKTLFCSFSATFTLNFLNSVVSGRKDRIGFLGSPGLVDFGVFDKNDKELWNAYHLIIFVAMGAVGGLLGALFNSMNINLTKYRMKYIAKRRFQKVWRIMEVVLIGMVTTTTVFVVAMSLGTCLPEHHQPKNSTCDFKAGDQSFIYETKDFFCPGHYHGATTKQYYNDMATLMFNSQEEGIKQLFHQNGAFTLPTLFILFIFYFFIACWTYGSGVPSGLFIPCLIIGAAYGRFVATVFGYLAFFSPHYLGWLISLNSGTYALIGAVSFLGGVVRMMISLTVILVESTNEIEYGLPILLTVTVAKWVGDYFNKGIYDKHIELKKTPFLEWESPQQLDKLIAGDVMATENLSYLYPITRVCSIIKVLKTTSHNGFLVVSPCKASSIRTVPKSVKQVTPQLYKQDSMVTNCSKCSPHSEHPHQTPTAITEVEEEEEECNDQREIVSSPSLDEDRDYCKSYTLPAHRRLLLSGVPPSGKQEVEGGEELVFRGLILRVQLIALLKNKIFFNEGDGPESQREIDHATLTYDYPRYPSIFKIDKDISETEKKMLMDLSLFMNPSPYTISEDAPLPQVFNLFRTMGLRHLPVIKEHGLVAGIITRYDLTHEKLHYLCHQKKRRERAETDAQKHAERSRTINYTSH